MGMFKTVKKVLIGAFLFPTKRLQNQNPIKNVVRCCNYCAQISKFHAVKKLTHVHSHLFFTPGCSLSLSLSLSVSGSLFLFIEETQEALSKQSAADIRKRLRKQNWRSLREKREEGDEDEAEHQKLCRGHVLLVWMSCQ